MYHIKQKVDGLRSTLEGLDGTHPVGLISFLTTLQDTLDTPGTSKGADVRVLASFSSEDDKDVHSQQFSLVEYEFEEASSESPDHETWP